MRYRQAAAFLQSPIRLGLRGLGLVMLSLCLITSATAVNAEDNEVKPIRIASLGPELPPRPPYLWYNHCTQQSEGFVAELYKKLSKDLGRPIEEVRGGKKTHYSEILARREQQLLSGKIDIAIVRDQQLPNPKLAVTRQAIIDIQTRVVLGPKMKPITQIGQLSSYQGVMSATKASAVKSWLRLKGLNATLVRDTREELEYLLAGKADYSLSDSYIARQLTHENQWQHQLSFTDIMANRRRSYLATRDNEEHRDLIANIDRLLLQYQQQGLTDHWMRSSLMHWLQQGKHCHR